MLYLNWRHRHCLISLNLNQLGAWLILIWFPRNHRDNVLDVSLKKNTDQFIFVFGICGSFKNNNNNYKNINDIDVGVRSEIQTFISNSQCLEPTRFKRHSIGHWPFASKTWDLWRIQLADNAKATSQECRCHGTNIYRCWCEVSKTSCGSRIWSGGEERRIRWQCLEDRFMFFIKFIM